MWLLSLGFLIGAAGLGAALIAMTAGYLRTRGILDLPTDRGLHSVPVPRGGGLGIVATVLVGLTIVAAIGLLDGPVALGIGAGIALIAGVGWCDDRIRLGPLPKLLVHIAAAALVLSVLGVPAGAQMGLWRIAFGDPSALVYGAVLVWMTNLYNFMDGADGLAGTEGVTVALPAALAFAAAGAWGWALLGFATAGACAAFLRWNWAPARLFMGDVGSGALGFLFAVLAIAGEHTGALPALAMALLLAVFVIDATATLLHRVLRGERWLQAHRSHAYQLAVTAGVSHSTVSIAVAAINVTLCWPAAWMVLRYPGAAAWVTVGVASIMLAMWALLQHRYRRP
jgi:Fuc2NAc and GlcNAc transferase